MDYGIQMYSIRDLTPKDMKAALKGVADIGYKYVEFAGLFDHPAEQIREWLDEFGLICSGTHTGTSPLENDPKAILDYHRTIGTCDYIIPGTGLRNPEEIGWFVDFCKKTIPMLREEGFRLHYHNHDSEFRVLKDGILPYSYLELQTELSLELDTYWLYVAGTDPLAVMERLKDRVRFIHVKDGNNSGHGAPLGQGTAPVADVVAAAKRLGFTMIVESETLNPTGLEEAKISFEYLKSLEEN